MTTNSSDLRGLCPPPFYDESKFGDGGFVEGRLCQQIGANISCCLGCPLTDWVYPDNFESLTLTASWITVAGMVCCVFLLLSWAFLPVDVTHRHYLSVSLTIAVVIMNMGFIIPLAAQPEECYDEITPNGMETSPVCAASGVFLLGGGWAGIVWVFLRALSLHLQICWQMVVGRGFMWFSQVAGWIIPIIGLVIALALSGVSFRFGKTCHANHDNSLGALWIPLLVFAGLTVILQFATFAYCVKVYLASLTDNRSPTETSSGLAYTHSIRTMTPRQAYRRVRRVIQLQWRGIIVVLIIIADVIFFAVVFVFQDNILEAVKSDFSLSEPWITCLVELPDRKDLCLDDAKPLTVPLPTVMAVLILLSMNGIWALMLFGRIEMIRGWVDFFRSRTFAWKRRRNEFVSVDAHLDPKGPRAYEMLSPDSLEKPPRSPLEKPPRSPLEKSAPVSPSSSSS